MGIWGHQIGHPINEGAFSGCCKLKKIAFTSNTKTISKSAFYGCSSITEIDIPENIILIGREAFNECDNLEIIRLRNTNPSKIFTSSPIFSELSFKSAILYVPLGTKDQYYQLTAWNHFSDIREYDLTGIKDKESQNNEIQIYLINGLKAQNKTSGINLIKTKGQVKKYIRKVTTK